jgi:hypothetical protein
MKTRMLVRATVMLVALLFLHLPARGADVQLRGERVGWARLKTPSDYWRRHATGDPVLMRFLRENTSLNIDPTWYVADIQRLDELCAYPLLFSQGVGMVVDAQAKSNLAEYMRRGGFLLIDCCINRNITPSADVFLQDQVRLLSEILPEARVVALPPNHDVYRCYFQIPGGKPPHTYNENIYNPEFAKHGLYAIKIGSRVAGIISLSGLQCGWDGMIAPEDHDIACMKMLVNIYIYAMLQSN